MVQQIITGLSGAATEEEKVAIIIKLCLDCWSAMPTTNHRPQKIIALNASGIERQAYEDRKPL
jgi:hypothetical protein